MRNLAFIALVLLAGQVFACCMVPRSYPGDVDQKGQKVLIMYHNGREELVLKVAPYFVEKKNDTPGYLAWLVTVPNKPLAYEVVDDGVYDDARALQDRLDKLVIEQRQSAACAAGDDYKVEFGRLEISDPVRVGPYTITPVKAKGEEGLIELNAYLSKRGFPKEDHAHMDWFVKNEFTFLCIHITPPEGQAKLGNTLELLPLQISFETEHPYYPAMYSARQGSFSLQMHVLTSKPLDSAKLGDASKKLRADRQYNAIANPWTAKPLADNLQAVIKDWKDKPSHWFINTITSSGFNPIENGQPAIMNWKEDIFFPLGGKKDMPPDWYKGDGDPPVLTAEVVDDPAFTGKLKWLLGIFAVLALVFTWAWLISRSRESRKQLLDARERALRGENPSGEPDEEKEE